LNVNEPGGLLAEILTSHPTVTLPACKFTLLVLIVD
jgi:hypothetical protein